MDETHLPEEAMKKSDEKLSELVESGKDIGEILSAFAIDSSSLPSAAIVLFSLFLSLVRVLLGKICKFKEKAEDLKDEVSKLNDKVIDLKASRDPETSSTPASKAAIGAKLRKRDKDRSLRKKSDKKPGAQPGHKGHGLKKNDVKAEIVEQVEHFPSLCIGCEKFEECRTLMNRISHGHEYEIRTVVVDVDHVTYAIMCPMMEKYIEGVMPENVKSSQQYGDSVKEFVINQWGIGITSIGRICEIFKEDTGLKLSAGTVIKILYEFNGRCQPVLEIIREYLRDAIVKGADETGMSVNSTLYWLHVVCNDRATYLYADRKRGFEAITNEGLLIESSGTLVHDCFATYDKLANVKHAICLEHIIRELRKNGKHGHKEYFDRLEQLIWDMKEVRMKAIAEGKDRLEEEVIGDFRKKLRALIKEGLTKIKRPKRIHKTGKIPEGPARSVILRMQKKEDEIFRFLEDFDVPFSNNESLYEILENAKFSTKSSKELHLNEFFTKKFRILFPMTALHVDIG